MAIKPVATPLCSMPYHLKYQAHKVMQKLINTDIKEHPKNEPMLLVLNAVLAPKPDDSIRITLDARNVNIAIIRINHPIP